MKKLILLIVIVSLFGCIKTAQGGDSHMEKNYGEQMYKKFFVDGKYYYLFTVPTTNRECITYAGSSELTCWAKEKPANKKAPIASPVEEHKGW